MKPSFYLCDFLRNWVTITLIENHNALMLKLNSNNCFEQVFYWFNWKLKRKFVKILIGPIKYETKIYIEYENCL